MAYRLADNYMHNLFNDSGLYKFYTSLRLNGSLRNINVIKRLIKAGKIHRVNGSSYSSFHNVVTYLKAFELITKVLEDVYPGKWDVVIVDIDGSNNISLGFVIKHEDFTIINSHSAAHSIKGMYSMMYLYIESTDQVSIKGLYGARNRIDSLDLMCNYSHSHLPTDYDNMSKFVFHSFCLGENELGDSFAEININLFSFRSNIKDYYGRLGYLSSESNLNPKIEFDSKTSSFNVVNTINTSEIDDEELNDYKNKCNQYITDFEMEFQGMVMTIDNFLAWESLEGVPHKYIERTTKDKVRSLVNGNKEFTYTALQLRSRLLNKSSTVQLLLHAFSNYVKYNHVDFDYNITNNVPSIKRGPQTDSVIEHLLDSNMSAKESMFFKPIVKMNGLEKRYILEANVVTLPKVMEDMTARIDLFNDYIDETGFTFRGQVVKNSIDMRNFNELLAESQSDTVVVINKELLDINVDLIINLFNIYVLKNLYINSINQ